MLLTGLLMMTAISLAGHLGLLGYMSNIVKKIVSCPKCLTFWASAGVLLWKYGDPVISAAYSMILAYASQWIGLLLWQLNQLYDRIWEEIVKKAER